MNDSGEFNATVVSEELNQSASVTNVEPVSNKRNTRARTYPDGATSPDGTLHAPIHNLNQFCKKHGLNVGGMWMLMNGKTDSYRGWTRN